MIVSLSKSITHFLYNKEIIDEKELEIYQYGFEMIISTAIGFVIMLMSNKSLLQVL